MKKSSKTGGSEISQFWDQFVD